MVSACDSQVVRLHQRSVEDRWLDQWVKTSEWKPMSEDSQVETNDWRVLQWNAFFTRLKANIKLDFLYRHVWCIDMFGVFPTNGVERLETEIAANHWNQKIWNISNMQVATFWNISKFAAFNVQPLQLQTLNILNRRIWSSERKAGIGCRPTSFLACCESFWIFDFLKESPSYRSEEVLFANLVIPSNSNFGTHSLIELISPLRRLACTGCSVACSLQLEETAKFEPKKITTQGTSFWSTRSACSGGKC